MSNYNLLVSAEVALLLKSIGYNDICNCCYCTAVRHNGKDIDFDEECDLKSEGRENEIEYVPFDNISCFNCTNEDLDSEHAVACPDIHQVIDWFRIKHNIYFTYDIDKSDKELRYIINVKKFDDGFIENIFSTTSVCSYKETFNNAIKLTIEHLYE